MLIPVSDHSSSSASSSHKGSTQDSYSSSSPKGSVVPDIFVPTVTTSSPEEGEALSSVPSSQPSVDQSGTDQSGTDQSRIDQSSTDQSTIEQSASEHATTKETGLVSKVEKEEELEKSLMENTFLTYATRSTDTTVLEDLLPKEEVREDTTQVSTSGQETEQEAEPRSEQALSEAAANLAQTELTAQQSALNTTAQEVSTSLADASSVSSSTSNSADSSTTSSTASSVTAEAGKSKNIASPLASKEEGQKVQSKVPHPDSASSTSIYDIVTPFQREIQKRVPKPLVFVVLLSLVSIIPGLANTSFNPAISIVASAYKVKESYIQALTALYFLGMGLGQLFWGPLTDRFGRKKILVVASLLAVLINYIFINTTTYSQLELARLCQGFIFSCFGLLPTAVLRDTYSSRFFIVYNSWVMILFLLSPAFAPLIGGYITITLGWKWIFTSISGLAVIALLFYMLRVPETLDPLRKQPINPRKIAGNFASILKEPASLICLILSGSVAFVLLNWSAAVAPLLITDHGVAPENLGYYSLIPVLFTIIANKINSSIVKKYSPQNILVYASIIQLVFIAVNFTVAFYFLGPWGLVLAQTCNALFTGFQNANLVSIYLMNYSHMVGTASSLFLSFRTILPSFIMYFVSFLPRYDGKTFLFVDAGVICITCFFVLLYNYLYPCPGDRFHRLRRKALLVRYRSLKTKSSLH